MDSGKSFIPKFNSRLPELKYKFGNQNGQGCAARSNLRRSKSFTDLRSLVRPEKKELNVLKPINEARTINTTNKPKPQTAVKKAKKSLSCTNLTRVNNVKINPQRNAVSGTKRPITTITKVETAVKRTRPMRNADVKNENSKVPEKPKVTKPASYDYKARFNLLNDKHTTLRKNHGEIKEKFEQSTLELDELRKNDEIQKERIRLLSEDQARLKVVENEFKLQQTLLENSTVKIEKLSQENIMLEKNLDKSKEETSSLQQKYNTLMEDHDDIERRLKNTLEQLEAYKTKSLKDEDLRRHLHNLIQEMKGNIRVFCRVRPQLPGENDKSLININYIDETTLELRKSKDNATSSICKQNEKFSFDKVFSPQASQNEVFEDLAQLVQSALDGYHVCVFAYGQTGSGKTFTMQGQTDSPKAGMIPRSMKLLFEQIEELKKVGWEYSVEASFLEIYNEVINDLLDNVKKTHEIRYNDGRGVTVSNLIVKTIKSEREFYEHMLTAQNNRAVAATNFNEHSSRSHALTKIYLNGVNKDSRILYTGSINLVDLAGSECAKTSCNERLSETKNINRSLSALGNVILALHKKESHVPYRDSKLTYILQSCLGGNSKTLMVTNVSPLQDSYGETVNSLRFAAKVKNVKIASRRNKAYVDDV